LSVYLDTSFLVAMFVIDANETAAINFLTGKPDIITSDWAVAEYSSALGLMVRIGRIAPYDRAAAEADLDRLVANRTPIVAVSSEDIVETRRLLRSARSPLRTPDALHLALCRRLGTPIATFDEGQRRAAIEFGIAVARL